MFLSRFRSIFLRDAKRDSSPFVRGDIGHFGLSEWWFRTFSEHERRHIADTYTPLGSSGKPLIEGEYEWSTQTAVGLLSPGKAAAT